MNAALDLDSEIRQASEFAEFGFILRAVRELAPRASEAIDNTACRFEWYRRVACRKSAKAPNEKERRSSEPRRREVILRGNFKSFRARRRRELKKRAEDGGLMQ